jgi:rhodanese-related sulfurtransferase
LTLEKPEELKFNEQNVATYHLAELVIIAVFDKSQEIVLFCQSGQRSELLWPIKKRRIYKAFSS